MARRAQKGCQASFVELVHRYGPGLLAFLQQKTGSLHDAEDLVQDTFIKAYRNIHHYRSSFRFSTWLFTIATRLANSHYRRRRTLQITDEREFILEPHGQLDKQESHENLWILARNLSTNQYKVLWLKYAEDMSVREIARVMRKSQVCVKVLLYRARMNLFKKLNKQVIR